MRRQINVWRFTQSHFFHPDYTVGTGFKPVQHMLAGLSTSSLHRRWGISPRPEAVLIIGKTQSHVKHTIVGKQACMKYTVFNLTELFLETELLCVRKTGLLFFF